MDNKYTNWLMSLRQVTTGLIVTLLFIVWSFLLPPFVREAVASPTTPVSVTITKVKCIDDCRNTGLEAAGQSAADFYAKIDINGVVTQTPRGDEDSEEITPNWRVTADIPNTQPSFPVSIQIWDHDSTSGDDLGDASPVPGGDNNLDFTFDRETRKWSGDVNWPNQCAQGGNPGGEPAVEVCFEVGGYEDADDDGLLDDWEKNGLDADSNGSIDVNLPAMGANPLRKDLFLEIDCLVSDSNSDGDLLDSTDHSHCPLQGAVRDVVQSFANAPVSNSDGTTGIQLHVDTGSLYGSNNVISVVGTGGITGNFGDFGGGGSQIPEAGNTVIDYDGAAGNPATNFYTLKTANFNPLRQLIFRYGLFAHQTNLRSATNDCTSGYEEGSPANDFMVTLGGVGAGGNACWGVDANNFSIGSQAQQAGTLMHEFGHTLGFAHGGGDGVNNKPNYLSVMNYAFQMCSVPTQPGVLPGQCDYSRDAINLIESSLDECVGFDNGLYGFGSANWNGNTILEGVTNCQPPNTINVSADINGDMATTSLAGYDDWDKLVYKFRDLANAANGVSSPVPAEADPDTIERSRQILSERLQPILQIEKTGPKEAIIGETLAYTLKVKNIGRGPALNVVLKDIFPDGSNKSFELATMPVGSEAVRNVQFTVPLTTLNDTTLKNILKVTYKDIVGNEKTAEKSLNTRIIPKFEYTAKLICGLQKDSKDLSFTKGVYATSINIHNPNYFNVPFFKKLALAFPTEEKEPTRVFPISTNVLRSDEAATIDCVDIKNKLFPAGFPTPLIEGFVVIQSRSSLDVNAIYTTASLGWWGKAITHSSIDVERIPERKIESEMSKPDLVVSKIENLDVDCPEGAGTCVTQVRVTISNIGTADATKFNTKVVFDPAQSLTVSKAFSGGLAASASQSFTVKSPRNGNCFDPDCTICVTVDIEDDVLESNEANNELCESKAG